MYLTISKQFEISLSYRYYRDDWSVEANREAFGRFTGTEHGFGGNFTACFVFHGPVDDATGMLINVTIIKKRILTLLAERYDHKFLNRDNESFRKIIPTPENVARQMLADAAPLFADENATLVACHLTASPHDAATAYADGRIERHYERDFSAARVTRSPHLGEKENHNLFGVASSPSGHGHQYRLRATLCGPVADETGMIHPESDCDAILADLVSRLDHRNLNTDVPELRDVTMTTEYLSRFLHTHLATKLPVDRIRLWENPWFFAESVGSDVSLMGVETTFRSAHRLHSPCLNDDENRDIYGKCNNLYGHGHQYCLQAAIAGRIDPNTGIFCGLERLRNGLAEALTPWDFRHLDRDTDDFTGHPSTGENIVRIAWPRIEAALDYPLHRLRLWETPNNRFTLRRDLGGVVLPKEGK